MVYIVSDKKSWARGVRTLVNNFGVNGDFNQRSLLWLDEALQQLAEQLHWRIIWKFEKRKVYSCFKHKIWAVDLADMQLICKLDKGIRFLLCVGNVFSKDPCVASLKEKKGSNFCKCISKHFKWFQTKAKVTMGR